MTIKLVYTIVSDSRSLFFEQALASAWSARYYNPDIIIVFICDEDTYKYIEECYKSINGIADSFVVVKVPKKMNRKETSRWIKTTARKYVTGPMIQIDTDTLVCGNLSELAHVKYDVAAAFDYHCNFRESPYRKRVIAAIEKVYGKNNNSFETNYYNSGVIFSNDTEKARQFYEKWHHYWLLGLEKEVDRDQLAFYKAAMEVQIDELSGVYNCMVRTSLKFFYEAKIMHFFNSGWGSDCANVFFNEEIYLRIKEKKCITPEVQLQILNCKSSFISPSIIVAGKEADIIFEPVFLLLRTWGEENSKMLKAVNLIARAVLKIKGK